MNTYDDVELDAGGMRALAHPVRLRVLFELRSGPATATMLSERVGASPSVTSWHLRHLAQHGLVADAPELGRGRQRFWRQVGRGFRYAISDEPSRLAATALQSALDEASGDAVAQWRNEVRPALPLDWAAESGSQDTTIRLTQAELTELNSRIEAILAAYVTRDDPPTGARAVRIVRHTMPSADDAPR